MAFRNPQAMKLGAKFLIYGTSGSGKTCFMLGFPGIAAIDTEAGLSFYEGTEEGKNLKLVSNTQSYKELEDDIDTIRDSYKDEGIKTFAVDSNTKVKENLEETIMTIDERRERRKGKDIDETNLSIRSRGRIKYVSKKLQNLKIDLSTQGVHIVDIAQAKEVKEKRGDQFVLLGYEPDMQKGARYDYDVVLFFYNETDAKGNERYLARVEKDRTKTTKKGEIIENPSYDIWADKLESFKDKEALNTSFTRDNEDSKVAYEEEVEAENMTLMERMKAVVENLDEDERKAFSTQLKEAGIRNVKDLDKLKPEQKEALGEILDRFS